jgi:peroxiredoxin/thioredoxin-like negative regulator of GroEL
MKWSCAAAALILCATPVLAQETGQDQNEQDTRYGHSSHGSAFDKGLRTKPWKMDGIGKSHFPITSEAPEIQFWFDQGNTLLHSFWWEEAERSFRWCAKLDPDHPMPYFGMARCGLNWFTIGGGGQQRYKDFLNEAIKRKDKASPQEQMYIEAWEAAYLPKERINRTKTIAEKLQAIIDKYPDDIEAKALHAMYSIRLGDRAENEKRINAVFAEHPDHPGAHHYLIHNWDDHDPIRALKSCEEYGIDVPGVGHANHMPGHVYSKVGMWKEAAFAMDAATRVELKYMQERLKLPFETWNYAHNRNYLCYIQEHLGQAETAISAARDLVNAPLDPQANSENGFGPRGQGMIALVRALTRFEMWEEILTPGTIPWGDSGISKRLRPDVEAQALMGLNRFDEARAIFDEVGWNKDGSPKAGPNSKQLHARFLMDEGKHEEALAIMKNLHDVEGRRFERTRSVGDPPMASLLNATLYGRLLLERGKNQEAADAFEESLRRLPGDAAAYYGLAKAQHRLGNNAEASEALGHLKYLYSDANNDLGEVEELEAMGITSDPISCSPKAERGYTTHSLDHIGPLNWEPFAAPEFRLQNTEDRWVELKDYRGKNVLLVFYLGDECVHCVEQLQEIVKKNDELIEEETVVLAISSTTPEYNRDSLKLMDLPLVLLSDVNHENARRYQSYDDFEDMELHSTILIDKEGRVRWKRTGGDPFMGIDFLLQELRRVNTEPLPDYTKSEVEKKRKARKPFRVFPPDRDRWSA